MKLLFLFFIQLIWASSYVSQKLALAEMPAGLVLVFRYGLAALFFLLAGQYSWREKFNKREWLLIGAVGVLNFSGSPYFQLSALKLTYAIDVSILVAFEPMIAALLAVLFLKERVSSSTLVTFLLATLGVLIMASGKGALGTFQWLRLTGDAFFFLSLVCEGCYSVASRHLVQKYRPMRLLAWMMLAGFFANLIGHGTLLTPANLADISWAGWFNLGYLALFCSVLGYGVWVRLLKKIPVNQLVLSLFLQPLLGSALAVLILKERLDLQTLLGGGVVFLSLLIWLGLRSLQKEDRNVNMMADLGGGGAVDKVG